MVTMQDDQDDIFDGLLDTSQMDDAAADLLDGMVGELLGDEDFVQCMTDQKELMAISPELQAALANNVDGIMNNMDLNMSGDKLKASIDIPESAFEAGKSACLDAGAIWQTYSKFNCEMEMMGLKMSMKINNLGGCMPDTDACVTTNSR